MPLVNPLPGMVISTSSSLSLLSFSSCSTLSLCTASSVSTSSLASFTSLPIAGRSSGDKSPIPLRKTVSSPFLPRYLTLLFSSWASSLHSFISLRALSKISLSLCCILPIPFLVYIIAGIRFEYKKTSSKGRSVNSVVPPYFTAIMTVSLK